MCDDREREWLSCHPHYYKGGVRVFPNRAPVLTKWDIVQFAALGRHGLESMEGEVLGVSPEMYAYMNRIDQQNGSQDRDALIEFFAGPRLPEDDPVPLQPWQSSLQLNGLTILVARQTTERLFLFSHISSILEYLF